MSGQIITLTSRAPLRLDPAKWNNPATVRKTNCISFALDCQEAGFQKDPGHLGVPRENSGLFKERIESNKALRKLWLKANPGAEPSLFNAHLYEVVDGLERIRAHSFDPARDHIMAFHPAIIHWHRLEDDGFWAEKLGAQDACKTDLRGDFNDMNQITYMPRMLSRIETVYFRVPRQGIQLALGTQ